jgi:hypothetical protein
MDRQPDAGKDRGSQGNPEENGKGSDRVFAHVAQTEPDKEFEVE